MKSLFRVTSLALLAASSATDVIEDVLRMDDTPAKAVSTPVPKDASALRNALSRHLQASPSPGPDYGGVCSSPPPPTYAPDSFCSIVSSALGELEAELGCTCIEMASGAGARLTCQKCVGGQNIPVIGQIPVFKFAVALEIDGCSDPASFTASASVTLPPVGQLLDDAIQDVVNIVDDATGVPIKYDEKTYTLSFSKTVKAEETFTANVPVFYVEVASVDVKFDLSLSGNLADFNMALKMDLCMELMGDLAALMPSGMDHFCASELPNCAGCGDPSGATCPWIQQTFPCEYTSSVTSDGGCDPNPLDGGNLEEAAVNTLRTAADGACDLMGHPNIYAAVGSPPWPIVEQTYQFSDACQAGPAAATHLVTKSIAASNSLSDFTPAGRAAIKNQLSFTTGAHSADTDVGFHGGSTIITVSIRARDAATASAISASLDGALSNEAAAGDYLSSAHGAGLTVTVVSVEQSVTTAPSSESDDKTPIIIGVAAGGCIVLLIVGVGMYLLGYEQGVKKGRAPPKAAQKSSTKTEGAGYPSAPTDITVVVPHGLSRQHSSDL